jgi:hypothetical protein
MHAQNVIIFIIFRQESVLSPAIIKLLKIMKQDSVKIAMLHASIASMNHRVHAKNVTLQIAQFIQNTFIIQISHVLLLAL